MPRRAGKRCVASWSRFHRSIPGGGSTSRRFSRSCACGAWSATPRAATPKRFIAASWSSDRDGSAHCDDFMRSLKERTIRGGVAKLCAQAANFVVRLAFLMIIARLLAPEDFGLVGMVTAFTGVLNLLKDF